MGTKPASRPQLDFMSNSIRLKYADKETSIKRGNMEIPTYKVDNSQFNMYVETSEKAKSHAVRLCERNLRAIQAELPEDFVMPDIVVVDFDKYGLNIDHRNGQKLDVIAGYDKATNRVYINSEYNTVKKIREYINRDSNLYANKTIYSPYIHELGHKYYEDCVKTLAKSESLGYNKAKSIIDHRISDYINSKDVSGYILSENISRYAFDNFVKNNFTDIIAESFAIRKENTLASELISAMKGELL